MSTNSATTDAQSIHEYTDVRRREYCEMLNRPNDEIAQPNRHSTNPEYIELYYAPSEHQYERVLYSTIRQNEDDKSKVDLGLTKQILTVIIFVVIIVSLALLCVIFIIYIVNMLSEHKDFSIESNFKNKNDSSTTMSTSSSTVASTSQQTNVSKSVATIIMSTPTQTVLPRKIQRPEKALDDKREFVKEMMLESWNAYERYAWGHGEVSPVSKKVYGGFIGKNSGLTLITSMSTLWIMGLKDGFNKGKRWIETKLDLSKLDQNVRVHDVIVHYVGGLLSCYALTNEQLFMNKALTIAQLVEPAFNTSTGLPYHYINMKTSEPAGLVAYLSHASGFQLDFNYLSDASGNDKFRKQIEKIQNVLKERGKANKLYLNMIDIDGQWRSNYSSLFGLSCEFYISLVKSYIQSNHLDVQSIEMYKESMDAVEAVKMFKISPNGLYYTRIYYPNSKSFNYSMYYSSCYLGAMLSLGASAMQQALALNSSIGDKDKVTQQNRINRHWHLAIQITRTCQQAFNRTKTGLGPEEFYFDETHDVIDKHRYYSLRPELAESNLILWRLTHNETYRDNAWQMALAIHRHCRVEGGGYSTIMDVNQVSTRKLDHQQAVFLSATLKYLYLTFTDDSILPLDQFVFNSVGHPLPILANITLNSE